MFRDAKQSNRFASASKSFGASDKFLLFIYNLGSQKKCNKNYLKPRAFIKRRLLMHNLTLRRRFLTAAAIIFLLSSFMNVNTLASETVPADETNPLVAV